jgi:hypothetical protein
MVRLLMDSTKTSPPKKQSYFLDFLLQLHDTLHRLGGMRIHFMSPDAGLHKRATFSTLRCVTGKMGLNGTVYQSNLGGPNCQKNFYI